MIELRLHGSLARDFGKVWNLEVTTVREAVSAICHMKPGFRQVVLRLEKMGLVFRVRTKTEDLGDDDLELKLGDTRVDIIPIVRGASAGVRFIIGAILVAVGVFMPSAATPYLISTGISLMVGSVAELLAPRQKKDDSSKAAKSWTLSGPLNTADQGQVIPVIYGEVLTGGVPISAGLSTAEVSPGDSVAPDCLIGGIVRPTFDFGGPVESRVVELRYSVSPYNMDAPNTYSWNVTGYPMAKSIEVINSTTATVTVRLTYTIATEGVFEDAGIFNVTVTGKEVAGNQPPNTVSAVDSLNVRVQLDTNLPWYERGGS